MGGYLKSVEQLWKRTAFNQRYCSELELKSPGLILTLDEDASRYIDTRLRKRTSTAKPYRVPIPDDLVPRIVVRWVAHLITPECFLALGTRPTDEEQAEIIKLADRAEEQIKEAADAVNGLFDIPLLDAGGDSLFDQPATLCITEQSPYSWRHKQYDAVAGDRRYG